MHKLLCSIVGIAGLALSFVPVAAHADKVSDLYFQEVVQRYFELPQNARTFGMAGSSVATSTDSSSIVGNPAGLGLMKEGEFSGSYSYNSISGHEFPTEQPVVQRENFGSGMLAIPVGPTLNGLPDYGNIGLAWAQTDGTWRNDSFDTVVERTQVALSYAYALSPSLSLGYGLAWTDDKFQSHEIFNYPMGNGFRHTLGATWVVDSDLTVGSSLFVGHGKHHALFGPGTTGNSSTLEEGLDVGAQYKIDQTLLAASVDYKHLSTNGEVISSLEQNFVGGDENGNIFDVRLGVEESLSDAFKVRAGYRFAGLASYNYSRVELNPLNGSAYYSAVSLGAGYSFPVTSDYIHAINLDYGVEWRDIGHGDWQHVVTLSVPFNVCERS